MPHTLISEIICFTFLIVLLSVSMIMFSLYVSSSQISMDEASLTEVTNYVASVLTDLVSVANSTNSENLVIYRSIEIPMVLNGKGYVITLEENNNKWYVVGKFTTSRTWLKGQTELWSTDYVKVVDNITKPQYSHLAQYLVDYGITQADKIYSGAKHPVVWCIKLNGTIYVGIGGKS